MDVIELATIPWRQVWSNSIGESLQRNVNIENGQTGQKSKSIQEYAYACGFRLMCSSERTNPLGETPVEAVIFLDAPFSPSDFNF